jgi:hypothetical protein
MLSNHVMSEVSTPSSRCFLVITMYKKVRLIYPMSSHKRNKQQQIRSKVSLFKLLLLVYLFTCSLVVVWR